MRTVFITTQETLMALPARTTAAAGATATAASNLAALLPPAQNQQQTELLIAILDRVDTMKSEAVRQTALLQRIASGLDRQK
jgi:hypothetical protein